MEEITFIDLFAGASGMSEGFLRAGFKPVAHIEMDSNACDTIRTRAAYHYLKSIDNLLPYFQYIRNKITREDFYKLIPSDIIESVINIEITDDSIKNIFKIIEKKNTPVDMIIGGPPCQAYSLMGRYQEDIEHDPRNKLYIQYGRFLKKFNPKVFVFENVPGIISAHNGQHFKNLKAYFRRIGYEVYFEKLNAADYGVLQARKRIIIVGWRNDMNFGFPEIDKISNAFKVKDVLADLPQLAPGEGSRFCNYIGDASEYLNTFHLRNGVDFVTQHICRQHNSRDLKIYRLAIEKWNKEGIRIKYPDLPADLKTHKNQNSFIDRFKVVDGDGVSHTVVAHIAKDGHYYIHPDEGQCRSISVREAARLQSFPDDFFFEGSRSAAFRQIGNAVPPLMAFAIAQKIRELLWQTN